MRWIYVLVPLFGAFYFGPARLAAQNRGQSAMVNDPYFNPVSLQLIQTPASSRRALEEAARQRNTAVEPRLLIPIDSAQSWARAILNSAYDFPRDTPFLAFPQEDGLCDVIRAVYRVGDREVEIAQSVHLISIKIKGNLPDTQTSSNLRRTEEIARTILTGPERFHFEETGSFRSGTCGRQVPRFGNDIPPGAPNWVDELRWWSSGDEVGFVTLKADGGPTKALISPTEGMNKFWFR